MSDTDHPLQALADLLTVKQLLGRIEGARIAYVGDADNNVARSLAQACVLAGAELTLASPEAYALADPPYGVRHVVDPAEAVSGAQIVYTDVWVSMGQDEEADARRAALAAYQVDEALMAKSDDAWFLHCLPARRGEEVADAVIESAAERGLEAGREPHAHRPRRARLAGGGQVMRTPKSSPAFAGEGDQAKPGGGASCGRTAPPPRYARSPSPRNRGEDPR